MTQTVTLQLPEPLYQMRLLNRRLGEVDSLLIEQVRGLYQVRKIDRNKTQLKLLIQQDLYYG